MKPLDGVKVVDLTRHMAGPYATQMLSDFGADVIKVESVPHGDRSRRTGTAFSGDESGLFLIWNRGKRSLAIDMRSPSGCEAVRRLAESADILIENYRPGVADKIGLGYDSLKTANPGLIYIALSAFGSNGPWSEDPGTDPVVQAMSGVMSVTGESDGGPLLIGVPIADYAGAMTAAQAAMLGLIARGRTGHRAADRDLDARGADLRADHPASLMVVWRRGAHASRRRTQRGRPLPGLPHGGRLGGGRGVGSPATRGRASARRSTGPTSSSIRHSRTTSFAWPIASS